MFNVKKTSLYEAAKASVQPDVLAKDANIFEQEMYALEHRTLSGNGAEKLSTTGNPLVDDFGTLARFKAPREINDIFATMEILYATDPLLAVKEMCYLRMVTRDTRYMQDLYKSQRGQGLRHEFLGRCMWLAINHPETFKKNYLLFISIGSWQDFFDLLEMDLSYVHNGRNHALDWKWMLGILAYKLQDEDETNLIKKYLPQIKNAKRCTTLHSQCTNYIAKQIATYLFGNEDKAATYAQYRRLKASGTAHQWQQAISRKDFSKLNFGAIAGRALQKMVNSKFLENHNLEKKYEEWIEAQPVAKFTGFAYELLSPLTHTQPKAYQKHTIDKQFLGLIETARQDMNTESKFIVCIDSSGSMTAQASGANCSALDVAKSMGLYFSYLLDGPFKDTFLEFESTVHLHSWSHYTAKQRYYGGTSEYHANTPSEKFLNPLSGYCGSTNFCGVAEEFVRLKQKGYAEKDFPTGVICISDGEFNRCGRATNFDQFLNILRKGGFSEEFVSNFKIVLWDIPNGYYGNPTPKFEALANRENFFYMSGFDGAGIAFLTGKELPEKKVVAPKTAEELFLAAMDQEILNCIEL